MKNSLVRIFTLTITFILLTFINTGCESGKPEKIKLNLKQKANTPITIYLQQLPNSYERVLDEVENRSGFKIIFKQLSLKSGTDMSHVSHYTTQILQLSDSGQQWDMAEVYGAGSLRELAVRDLLPDLTALFPKHATKYYSQLDDRLLAQVNFNGRIMAIPANIVEFQYKSITVREDLLKKYNIKNISTWNGLELFMENVHKKDPGLKSLFYTPNSISSFMHTYGYANIGGGIVYRLDDPEMKLVPWENTDEYDTVITTLKRWHDQGYITQGNPNGQGENQDSYTIRQGPYHPTSTSSWKTFELYPDIPTQALSDPQRGTFMILNKNSTNAERCLQFIEWVHSSKENYLLFTCGIEGVNYTVQNGEIVSDTENYYYGPHAFANISYMNMNTISSPILDQLSRNSVVPPHTGFLPDAELMQLMHDRDLIFQSESRMFLRGNFDEDYKEFMEELYKTDGTALAKRLQAELDKWNAERGSSACAE